MEVALKPSELAICAMLEKSEKCFRRICPTLPASHIVEGYVIPSVNWIFRAAITTAFEYGMVIERVLTSCHVYSVVPPLVGFMVIGIGRPSTGHACISSNSTAPDDPRSVQPTFNRTLAQQHDVRLAMETIILIRSVVVAMEVES
jgi:hypothetical protein